MFSKPPRDNGPANVDRAPKAPPGPPPQQSSGSAMPPPASRPPMSSPPPGVMPPRGPMPNPTAAGPNPLARGSNPAATPPPPIRPAPYPPRPERNSIGLKENDNGRLIVGQEIKLSGEITSCDRLVVEGTVDATLNETRALEVSESGVFRGNATVETAEINGTFDGDLSVENRLFIRSKGRVTGTIRYGELEIERGGHISGTLDEYDSASESLERNYSEE